jgi:hypothetical protein
MLLSGIGISLLVDYRIDCGYADIILEYISIVKSSSSDSVILGSIKSEAH